MPPSRSCQALPLRGSADDPLREEVHDERKAKEDHPEIEERRILILRRGARGLSRDLPSERVAGLEEVRQDRRAAAADDQDNDRLANRAPEAEDHGRRDAAA